MGFEYPQPSSGNHRVHGGGSETTGEAGAGSVRSDATCSAGGASCSACGGSYSVGAARTGAAWPSGAAGSAMIDSSSQASLARGMEEGKGCMHG